jgi:hypothetical protein
MAPSARRLVPALFRAYSSIGVRAGEKVVPVSNAHRTNQGVIQVRPDCSFVRGVLPPPPPLSLPPLSTST